MTTQENKRTTKRQYWQEQIKAWQASGLSQSAYCSKSEINLGAFIYWRKAILGQEDQNTKKFARVKILKQESVITAERSVQIKLLTGHMVHLPSNMETDEIARLICLIGSSHA